MLSQTEHVLRLLPEVICLRIPLGPDPYDLRVKYGKYTVHAQ